MSDEDNGLLGMLGSMISFIVGALFVYLVIAAIWTAMQKLFQWLVKRGNTDKAGNSS